ncbi:MAG TPA: hypothetical protein VIV11_36690 [Kofleriaceae bacterium]
MAWLSRLRRKRWANLFVINVRILIGFAFLPAALKKLLDQPFTDPANVGRFHDFLDAFRATGWFYQFVGIGQLVAALLLFSQRFALLGAIIALPILTAITAFCWSTQVYPTATVATLMWLGTLGLMVWDVERWRGVVAAAPATESAPVALRAWQLCGLAIFVLYVGVCVLHGGIYRPRGVQLDDPAFYVLPAIALAPVVTWLFETLRNRDRKIV